MYFHASVRVGSYYLGRLLGRNRQSLEKVSQRTLEICRGLRFPARRPYFDTAHLPRIRETQHFSVRQIVEEHLSRQWIDFRPVRVHWINDAWIVDGSVFVSGAQRIELRNALEKRSLRKRLSLPSTASFLRFDDGVLVGTCAGSTWFGHWLADEVPLLMLGSAYGKPIAPVRREYPHERDYLEAFGLPVPTRVGAAQIGMLVIVEEFAQNPHKTLRYELLRKRMAQNSKGEDRVFLFRGKSGTPRNLVNENELAERLEGEGFHAVDVGNVTFGELLEVCLGASVVVGVEGSHLAHALFMMKDYGTLLILSPPNQVHTAVADTGVFCRLNSGMFVCENVDHSGTGFVANLDEVLRFLEKLLLHGESSRNELRAYVDEVIALARNYTEAAILRRQ